MSDQPAETTTPPPWPVTGAFECRFCRTPYRAPLGARNCCAMRRSPGTFWDCGQEHPHEHPQGRLHRTRQDARECIERSRKADTDDHPAA